MLLFLMLQTHQCDPNQDPPTTNTHSHSLARTHIPGDRTTVLFVSEKGQQNQLERTLFSNQSLSANISPTESVCLCVFSTIIKRCHQRWNEMQNCRGRKKELQFQHDLRCLTAETSGLTV